jgi:hypothetical protein
MSGFPTRISRSALGPVRRNRNAIIKPDECATAETFNLLLWQLAGMNATAPIAWVLGGADGTRFASAEAWNPDGDDTLRPTISRSSAGVYVVTYAATYPDMDGAARPLVLLAGAVAPQGSTAGMIGICGFASNTITVKTTTHAGVAADTSFLLTVW